MYIHTYLYIYMITYIYLVYVKPHVSLVYFTPRQSGGVDRPHLQGHLDSLPTL